MSATPPYTPPARTSRRRAPCCGCTGAGSAASATSARTRRCATPRASSPSCATRGSSSTPSTRSPSVWRGQCSAEFRARARTFLRPPRRRDPTLRSRTAARVAAAAGRARAGSCAAMPRRPWRGGCAVPTRRPQAPAAEGYPTDEHLHDWRKRVRTFATSRSSCATRGPSSSAPRPRPPRTWRSCSATTIDLAVLTSRLGGEEAFAELRHLVAHRRAELQAEAFRLGRRIFTESPKRFTERVDGYLRRARREAPPALAA